MLEQEVSGWPGVTAKPMFGMLGLYRDGAIFAALPRTRALHTANSIIFKFDPMPRKLLERAKKDQRIIWEKECRRPRWYSFELDSANDVSDALSWLEQAYEAI
jgi:hypothetical protein